MGPTLSVVLSNYNHARYLPESLGAIAAQSLPPDEVIVLDDGSSDGSVAVIADFVRRYPFFRLIRNERNLGAMRSYNRGLAEAAGDFVLCPAADDRIRPGLFEKTAAILARHPEAGLCSAMCGLLSPDGRDLGPLHTPAISREACFVPPQEFFRVHARKGGWMMSQTAFYNRRALAEWGGGFDIELGSAADGFLLYVLAARRGACFIPERLGDWRKLDDSFALRGAEHTGRALAQAELLDRKLRATGLFPEAFLGWSMRSTLMAILYEIIRRRPHRADEMSATVSLLLRKDWTDRAFLAALPRLGGATRWGAKLYLLLQHPPRERLRIVGEKFQKLISQDAR